MILGSTSVSKKKKKKKKKTCAPATRTPRNNTNVAERYSQVPTQLMADNDKIGPAIMPAKIEVSSLLYTIILLSRVHLCGMGTCRSVAMQPADSYAHACFAQDFFWYFLL